MNPFAIEGPANVSFSGGRTSAFMLRRILDAGLAPDVHVLFANTGKERPETLDFVHEIETRWNVPIVWLEYRKPTELATLKNGRQKLAKGVPQWVPKQAVVTYETASRNAEPFDALLDHRRRLPNGLMRMCTQELKIRPMREWMKRVGGHAARRLPLQVIPDAPDDIDCHCTD